jgi:hypothetical protein
VAKSSLGKAVSRVGASGGGRTYRKSRPGGYYSILGLIVVLGLSSVAYSRYEVTHPYVASTAFPAVGSEGYVALAVDACGVRVPYLASSVDTNTAYTLLADNVIQIAPSTSAEAGSNVTLASFLSAGKGISISTSALTVPANATTKAKAHTYTAGTVCPAGSRYAGKKAYPVIATWTPPWVTPTLTTSTSFALSEKMFVTLAFVPKGVNPFQPSTLTVKDLLNYVTAQQSPTTTSTSSPSTTSTTTPVTTTTKG